MYNSNVTIANATVQNHDTGINVSGGSVQITTTALLNNSRGFQTNADPIGGNPHITSSWIRGNNTGVQNDGGPQTVATGNFFEGNGQNTSGNVDAGSPLSAVPNGVAVPFAVSTAADVSDAPDLSSVDALTRNRGADGLISLREAIAAANNTPGADAIRFALGTGAATVTLAAALPAVTDTLALDGSTQPGFTTAALITLDASAVAAGSPLVVQGPGRPAAGSPG